jgi:hypothetical protein
MMYVCSHIIYKCSTGANFGGLSHVRYVSVYPIALSVRTSNVYEERALGLAEDGSSENDDEEPTGKVWGSFLTWHARKQLAFGNVVRFAS